MSKRKKPERLGELIAVVSITDMEGVVFDAGDNIRLAKISDATKNHWLKKGVLVLVTPPAPIEKEVTNE